MTATSSLTRRKDAAYTDFAALVTALREAVAEMRRLTKRSKAETLLIERRVSMLRCNSRGCVADVIGDSGTYRVRIYRDGSLIVRECSCAYGQAHPAKGGCAHTQAVDYLYSPAERTAS